MYKIDDYPVIDVDSHLTEPPTLWSDRAPAKFADRVPQIRTGPSGRPRWMVDGVDFGPVAFTSVGPDGQRIAGETFVHEHLYEELHPGAYDWMKRLDWLDERGIDQQIVFPNKPGFGALRFYTHIEDVELRNVSTSVYNDAAAEIQSSTGNRVLPLALVPWWDIDEAVREVRRAKSELGLKGITMCESPHKFGVPALHLPEWDRFWSECEDLDIAVAFHIGSGDFDLASMMWFGKAGGEYEAAVTVNTFMLNSWAVANLIFSGLLLRHPRLKIFSAETGVGWVPFFLEAMDYQWHENILPDVKREVWRQLLPSEIFRRNFSVSFWFEQWGPQHAIEALGEDNIMFETDFPHGTSLTPRSTEQVVATLRSLAPGVRKKVLHDNAVRVFDL